MHMIRHYHTGMNPTFFSIPKQTGIKNRLSSYLGNLPYPYSKGNKICSARFLKMRKVSSGYCKLRNGLFIGRIGFINGDQIIFINICRRDACFTRIMFVLHNPFSFISFTNPLSAGKTGVPPVFMQARRLLYPTRILSESGRSGFSGWTV